MSRTAQIEGALGQRVARLVPLHGGDLSDVARADLEDGREVVVKTGPMVEMEARMLQAMRAANAPVPEVLHTEPGLILLQHLTETPPSPESYRALGAALAQLHGTEGNSYGWPEPYAFGPVEIRNTQDGHWPTFWAEHRLQPFLDVVPKETAERLETLCIRLPDLLPAQPRPALLHGDIWMGNALFSGAAAYLIDPSCYHGDPVVDLAMLNLFGQPPTEVMEGYGSLAAGLEARQPIYQLWPALVHLRLFGAGYHGLVTRLLGRAGV
ncbi:fructosamine kinase family protein [Roseovarius indicus]|uniref:Aminoglycoside phosphotransferase n=1 Tax=Roseovarius indicus TaxID=540747 RepID=A0A0T5P7U6_9RHOB|nr:fructosamine kinase family protein [Roseovarius indicus]KRS17132.1 aminoglycoside phosphotransferase [Roseovarius indicus]QEW27747.1 Fructosamine-3-kinase [Roseovarius indicus]SFE31784.1 Fructosamine-3-kinase [Roseovarius indicus]